jgi:UPF0716 protein FxsA
MPLLLLLLVFIAVPIAEIYVIIQVGQAIGALPTIAILIADSVVGSWLLRSQGRAAWRRFNQAIAERRAPAREVLDGVLIVFGGALLITPGFISDVLGIVLLAPPTRALIRALMVRNFTSRLVVTMGGGRRDPPRSDYDVDSTGHDVPPRPLGR